MWKGGNIKVLTVVCAVTALAVGTYANLLLNPGFENGIGEEATSWWRYESRPDAKVGEL